MEQTQAASSPAEVVDPFNGQTPSFDEFSRYRETGELPERFKPAEPAESATADAQEETESEAQAESAGESETPTEETQEQNHKPKNAAQRIAQLEAAIEAEWGKDDPDVVRIGQLNATIDKINGRPKRKSEVAPPQAVSEQHPSSTPQQAPQNYAEWEQAFKPEEWIEQYGKDNPTASYEKANAAMFSFMLNARDHFKQVEQAQTEQRQRIQTAVAEGEAIYGKDFSAIADQTAGVIGQDPSIPRLIKQRFAKSDVLPHLTYAIGENPEALEEFVKTAKTDSFKALDQIALIESGIREELAKPKQIARGEGGKFKAPEKKVTSAPAPPSPVGGSSARGFDVNDESLSPEEWMRKRNAQLARK